MARWEWPLQVIGVCGRCEVDTLLMCGQGMPGQKGRWVRSERPGAKVAGQGQDTQEAKEVDGRVKRRECCR